VYWLLTREIQKARGVVPSDEEFKMTVEEFEATL
jgi:small subunit ribosomal protein S2